MEGKKLAWFSLFCFIFLFCVVITKPWALTLFFSFLFLLSLTLASFAVYFIVAHGHFLLLLRASLCLIFYLLDSLFPIHGSLRFPPTFFFSFLFVSLSAYRSCWGQQRPLGIAYVFLPVIVLERKSEESMAVDIASCSCTTG